MQWSIYSSRLRSNVICLEIFPDSNFQTNAPFPTDDQNWTWFSLWGAWFNEFSREFLLTTFGLGSSDLLSPLFTYPAFLPIREPFSGGLWTFQTFWCSIFGVPGFLREAQYFTFWSSWSFRTSTWPSVRVTLCTDCCPRWGFRLFILNWKVLPQAIFCSFLCLSSNQFISRHLCLLNCCSLLILIRKLLCCEPWVDKCFVVLINLVSLVIRYVESASCIYRVKCPCQESFSCLHLHLHYDVEFELWLLRTNSECLTMPQVF